MKTIFRHNNSRFSSWRRKEKGAAEIYSAIIILPVLASMIFMLLEVGIYIHYRGSVDSIVQSTVRGISLEAGDNNPRANINGISWTSRGLTSLNALCSTGRCIAPTLACSPSVSVSAIQGTGFDCTATYTYNTVSPLSSNPVFSVGMSGLFDNVINITVASNVSGGA